MRPEITMHFARMSLNRNAEMREWAENWVKAKEREAHSEMSEEEFAKHWLYVRPERMHEGAIDAVSAYYSQHENILPTE